MNDDRTKLLALILGFALWGVLGYFGKVPLEPLIALLQMGLGGLITHMLQGAGVAALLPPAPAAEPAKGIAPGVVTAQAGFYRLEVLAIVAAIGFGVVMIAGCTTTTASAYSGLYTQAKAGVQVFDDNTLKTMRDLLCAQPYSAIQRNSDMQAGIVVLCGPMANVSSLDANQLALLMQLLGKAGVGVAAVPVGAASAASSTK